MLLQMEYVFGTLSGLDLRAVDAPMREGWRSDMGKRGFASDAPKLRAHQPPVDGPETELSHSCPTHA